MFLPSSAQAAPRRAKARKNFGQQKVLLRTARPVHDVRANPPTHRTNMKITLIRLLMCFLLGALAGCGKSSNQPGQSPDPATQPEAQAALFQRTCDRTESLIAAKDFDQARRTLELFKDYKLTPEQQQIVDKLKAKIPAK